MTFPCLFLALWCGVTEPNVTHTTSFVAFAADANANPPMVFGGKLLSEMDRCAGITVRRFLYSSPTGARDAVTVAVNNVRFARGAAVKDLIFVTGAVVKRSQKSITVAVKVEKETADGKRELLVEGDFVFVAYDIASKQAIPHGLD